MKMLINTHTLKAVNRFASKDESRYYLQGVYIEPDGESVKLTATNGHALVCAKTNDGWQEGETFIPFILRAEVIKTIKSKWVAIDTEAGKIYWLEGDKGFKPERETFDVLTTAGLSQPLNPIDGTFPDYKRVIPPIGEPTAFSVNPELFSLFEGFKVGKSSLRLDCSANGDAPIVVSGSNLFCEFVGAIMPMRGDKVKIPDWFSGKRG